MQFYVPNVLLCFEMNQITFFKMWMELLCQLIFLHVIYNNTDNNSLHEIQ